MGRTLGIIRGNYFVMPRQPTGMSTEDMSTREIMAELKKIIDAKGMSVEEFFGKMDTDGDGKINGPELSKAMKEAMEGLTFMQVSNIIKDLDSNQDYRIDVQELREALQEEE